MDASVAVSSLRSKLRSLMVEDNVRKRPFSTCLDPPPTMWANGSVAKLRIILIIHGQFMEISVHPNDCLLSFNMIAPYSNVPEIS